MKQSSCSCIVYLLAAVICLLPAGAHAQRGARTLPRALDQLSQEAAVIVHGNVTSARVEPHPQLTNLMTVVVSMKVTDTLKGTPRKTIEFRQYIWDIRDQVDAARYVKGEELLLLLGPVSEYGLTSPVGLEQGRFRITKDRNGHAQAVNGTGNFGLFQSVEQRAQQKGVRLSNSAKSLIRQAQPGPVPLADLKDAIRAFGRAQ